jgi:hypothetical protein
MEPALPRASGLKTASLVRIPLLLSALSWASLSAQSSSLTHIPDGLLLYRLSSGRAASIPRIDGTGRQAITTNDERFKNIVNNDNILHYNTHILRPFLAAPQIQPKKLGEVSDGKKLVKLPPFSEPTNLEVRR